MKVDCTWTKGTDGWLTACSHIFYLTDGSPSQHEMKYCCYCGGPLIEVPETEEHEK